MRTLPGALWTVCRIFADETATRALRALGPSSPELPDPVCQIARLEPRLLFSAAPLGPEIAVAAEDFSAAAATPSAIPLAAMMVMNDPIGSLSDLDTRPNEILENGSPGSEVGITVLAVDPDAGDAVIYSLDDSAGGRFAIDSNTGVVHLAGSLDRELVASHPITVRATSSDGSFQLSVFEIQVLDHDEFDVGSPVDFDGIDNAAPENALNGSAVGLAVLSVDGDATDNFVTYALDDDAGGRFQINPFSGVVTVADRTLIDFESSAEHTIQVRSTSSDGSFAQADFVIAIINVNESPELEPISLVLQDGQSIVLTESEFHARDPDTSDLGLTFYVNNVNEAQFFVVGTPSVPVTSFTQAQVSAGEVLVSHSGSGIAPGFEVTVSDGEFVAGPHAPTIEFREAVEIVPIYPSRPGRVFPATEPPDTRLADPLTPEPPRSDDREIPAGRIPRTSPRSSRSMGRSALNPLEQTLVSWQPSAVDTQPSLSEQTTGAGAKKPPASNPRPTEPSTAEESDHGRIRFKLVSPNGEMWLLLDQQHDEIDGQIQAEAIAVGAAGAAASSVTFGYLFWAVRSGFIASGLLAQMPAWRSIDPLQVLRGATGDPRSAESLEQMMERRNKLLPPRPLAETSVSSARSVTD